MESQPQDAAFQAATSRRSQNGLPRRPGHHELGGRLIPVLIGPGGVEKIYELSVADIREDMQRSATIVKEDLKLAAEVLREQFNIR